MSEPPPLSVRAAAAVLRQRGFAICKPDPKKKKPTYSGWSAKSLEPSDFAEGDQIGVMGGALSDGGRPGHSLIIGDLDAIEAVKCADQYLPATGMIEGRKGKPRSHRYWLVPNASIPPWALSTADQASAAAKAATGSPGPFLKHFKNRDTGKGVLDFIGTGGQVVCPPSLHPSGERREWAGDYPQVPGIPAVVDFLPLWEAVCCLASRCGADVPRVNQEPPRGRGEHVGTGIVAHARNYLSRCDPSVSGKGGHKALMWAARALVYGFDLGTEQAYHLLATEFNPRCTPQWSERELRHKVEDADRIPFGRPRGWLRDQDGWNRDARSGPRCGRVHGYSAADPPTDRAGDESDEAAKSRYKFTDSADFRKANYTCEWFVDYFLARHHPAVVAGPSKGMKTSVLVDLAVSIATGTPFLGKWNVPKPVRVAIVSGESGGYALQEMFFRVLRARGLPEDACDGWLKWEFSLPKFADLIDTAHFAERLAALECELTIIDPFYLTLGSTVDAKNMFEMGPALEAVSKLLIEKHKVTPVIAHHANKGLQIGEPMELQHLAYSGLEQFLGQYAFLNRRTAYENNGHHDLWFTYGGRPGHTGRWVLDIEEGVVEKGAPPRTWNVAVSSASEARDSDRGEKDRARKGKEREQNARDEQEVINVVDAEARRGLPGASMSLIEDGVSFSSGRAKKAVDRLLEQGLLVRVEPFQKPTGNGAKTTVKNGFGRPQSDWPGQ